MTSSGEVGLDEVAPNVFYLAVTYDADMRGVVVSGDPRSFYRADKSRGQALPDASLEFPRRELPPWPYVARAKRLFRADARAVIEAHLGLRDHVLFHELPMTMADGRVEPVFLAVQTDVPDVHSPHSSFGDDGVANWWALELSKLRDRAFFPVPGSLSTTVMRGDLVLALHELGWPGYIRRLRVMDGDQMVAYAEWAEHPEWTGYEP